jgi:hypothetical protein
MVIYSFNFSTLLSETLGISFEKVPELSDQNINLMPDDCGKLKGYKMPIEFGIAISEACKGRTANNKGKPNPAQKERFLKNNPMKNPEIAAKVSSSKKGKPSPFKTTKTFTWSCSWCEKGHISLDNHDNKSKKRPKVFCNKSCAASYSNTYRYMSHPPAAEQANS